MAPGYLDLGRSATVATCLVAGLGTTAGCTADPASDPSPERSPASTSAASAEPSPEPVLRVLGTAGPRSRLFQDCATVSDAGFHTPKLLWFTVRTTQQIRLRPLVWGTGSNAVRDVEQWTAPPGSATSPRAAVVDGGEPTADRLAAWEYAIGDRDADRTDVAPVQKAWSRRVPLTGQRALPAGTHTFFVRYAIGRNSQLAGLTMRWQEPRGIERRREIGSVKLVGRCGG